jgi:NUMOD3 motif
MFLDNKYRRWYDALIARARARGLVDDYTERHHVIPRCLGGSNKRDNLVDLTFREHFLVHWLLIKFTEGDAKRRMNFAMIRMGQRHLHKRRAISGWQYARAQVAFRESGLTSSRKGTKQTPEWIAMMRERMTGNKFAQGMRHSPETRALMSEQRRGNKHSLGRKLSEGHRAAIGAASARRGQSPETRAKMSRIRAGWGHTPEACAKMSVSAKRRCENGGSHWTGREHRRESREKQSVAKQLQKIEMIFWGPETIPMEAS